METVVLVHGLWVNGMDMALLRRRLARAGYDTRQFSYHSVRDAPLANAEALQRFVEALDAETVHFVGHSLGGLVLRHFFHEFPATRDGRVVTLGTPHRSSRAAEQLMHWLPGRLALGNSVRRGLLGNAPPWPAGRELGSIAGTLRLGLGLIVPGIPAPSDGTVAVEETRLPGMTDHLTLPVSHFGLLCSSRAAEETDHFLRHGRFKSNVQNSAEPTAFTDIREPA